MDARQLRYFLAVVDHGGFNKAADKLLIAQPSLSQTIKSLEKEVGVPLFHRVGRSSVLSEAGRALIGPARSVVRDLELAQSAVANLKELSIGRLDLVAMPSPGVEPLTSLLADYCRTYPGITVNVEAAFTVEEVLSAVRSGSAELGLLGASKPIKAQGVEVISLQRQPMMLIINPQADAFDGKTVVHREDLSGHRMVASQPGSLMRAMVDDMAESGIDLKVAVEVAHRTSVLPLVLAGVGHAILPQAWEPLAKRSGLKVLKIEPQLLLHVALAARSADLTPAASAFVALAQNHIQ